MVTGDRVEISLRWLIRGTSEKKGNDGDIPSGSSRNHGNEATLREAK